MSTPTFKPEQAKAQAPQEGSSESAGSAKSPKSNASQAQAAEAARASSAGSGNGNGNGGGAASGDAGNNGKSQHVVKAGDTLWAIAKRYKTPGMSMNAAMAAIYEANRKAFKDNMDRLKVDQVLELPELKPAAASAPAVSTAVPVAPAAPAIDNDQQTVQLPSTSDSEPAPEVPKALALAPAAPPEVAPKVDANAEQARALAAGTVDLDPEAALVDATKSEQDTDDAVAEDGKGTHDAPSGTRIFPIDASEVLTVAHLNSVMSSLVNKRGESIIFRLEFSGKVNLGVSVGGKVALELGYAITDSNFVAVYVLSEWAVKLGLSLGGFVNATGEGGMSDAWVRMWFDNHAEAAAYLIDWFRSSKLSEFVKFEEKDPEEKPEKGAAYGVSESAETYGAEISAEVAGAGKVAGEYKNQTIHRTFTARDQTAGQDSYESIEDHQIQKYTLDLAAVGAKGTYSNDRSEISGSPIYYYNGVFCDHALEIDVPKVGDKINAVIEAAFNAVTGLTSMSWGSRVTPEILAKVGTESTKARKNGMGLKVSFTWQEYGEPNAALGLTYFRVNVTPYVEAGGTAKGQIAEVTASAKLSTTQVLHESVSAETVSYIQRQFVYSSVDRPWEAFKAENEASIRALVANCADPTFQYYVPAVDKAFHAAEGENFAAGLAALEAHWSGEHEQVKSIQPDASNIAAEVRKTEGIGIQKVLPNTPTAAQLFQSANRIVAMLKKHENDDDHLAFLFERLNHFNTNWVVLERLMRQNGHGDYYHGLLQRARATGRLKIAEDNVEFHRAGDALHWLYEECVAAPDTAFDKVKSYLTDHAEDKAAREAVRTNTMLMDNVVRNFPDEQRSVIETLIIHGTLEVGPAVQVRLAAAGGKGDEVVRLLGELPRETLVLLETDTVFRTSLSKLPPVDIDGRLMTPGAYFLHKLGRSTSTDPGVARRGNEGFAGDLEIFAGKSEEEIRSSEEFQAWQKESDAAIAEAVKALDKQFDVWTYVSDANVLAILRAYETRTAKIAPFYRLQGLSAGRMLDDAYSAATGRGLRADIGKGLDIGNQKEAERLIGLTALQGATAGGLAEGRLSVGQALTQVVVADRTLAQSVQLTAERLKEELESMFGASDTTVLRLWRQLCTDFRTAGARKEGQPGNFEKLTGVDISTPEAADGLARSLLKSAYLEIGGDLAAAAAKGLSKRELENVRGPLALGAVEGAAQDGHDATAAKVFSALTGFDVDETGKSELSALGALISEACAKEGFTEFYRQKYGIDVFRHAGLIARAIGDESMWNDGLDIAEKMFPGGVPPETRAAAEKPASASTDEIVIPPGAAVDHGFTVQEAEQAAADMWQALMAGDVPAIERRVLKYSADEQKVVNACFRRLSGGIDWQFYAHQAMELQRDGDREHELTIGVEGTDAKVRTPDGEVSARDLGRGWFGGRDVEVDVHNADLRAAIENAETGTVSPQTRIRRHLAEGEIEIIFDVCDQLTDQQRQAVFADKAFMGELHAGLDNEMAWKRVYKVLSGQADLTDRLESRSDGSYGFWRFMEFSDADGMEKDLRAYIKDLKSRQIRALLAANPELSPQEADQQASRWVREQAIQLYNNRDVRAIIESELGPGLDQAKLDGTLLGGGEEDEVLYALQIGAWQHDETALVESIRRMSPEKRQQVLADPVYMANLSAILDDKDDYRDAMLALKSQAQPGDDDHLGALDRASRTSADVGFDWSVEEGDIMANLEQLTHEEHKRLAADPRLRAQILTALKDSPEDYRRARRILGFDGANVPGAGTEDVQYLVFNAATRLEGAAERDWDALLSAAVYVYKMEFKAQGSAEEEGAPAAAPATDADAMARSLRESVWKQAFAAIKRRCDKEGDATQSADARLELIRQAVFKENDPTMARIQANTGASWYGGDVTSSIEDAIKSASDDFIVSNWTTVFQPAPGAGAGQTLAQSYQRFVAARAKQESDPEAYRVARLDFLRFNVTFSGQFEKDLLHIAGGFFADRGQEDAMRIRDNSEWNSWVELLNGRINQLDWNAVAAKIGATGEDAALLDNSTRRALIAQAQTDRKVLGARGLQTSNDWHLAEAEQAEVDFEAIEYGRALREGLVAKDENGERGTLTSAQEFEADVQREQLETKVSDYKAQKAKIANLAATVAAVIAAGIIAALLPGPGTVAAAMVYGALVSGGSAAIESLAKESMLGSDYEVTTEGAKNVLTSAMTGAMIMGSTFFSSRVVGALSGKAGEMVRLPETFTKAAPAWWLKAGGVAKYVGSMGAESLEEVFSEGLEGIGQAGLAFLDPAIFTMGWERFSAYASSKAREQLEQIPNSMTQAAAATVLIKLGQSGRGKRPGGQAAAEGVDAAQDAATRQGRKRLGDAVETGLSAVNHGRAAKIRAKVREYFAEDWSETVQEAFIEWVLGQAQQGYVDLDNVGEDLLMNVLQEQREKYISMGVREVHTATRRRELDAKIEKHRSILTEAEIADLRARNEEMIANQELWTGGDVYGADIYENPEYYAAERQRRAELAVAQWQMAAGSLNDQQISAFIALARSQPSMPAFDAILRTNPHTIPEIAALAGATAQATRAESQDTGGASDIAPEASVSEPGAENAVDARTQPEDRGFSEEASVGSVDFELDAGDSPNDVLLKGLDVPADQQESVASALRSKLGDQSGVDWFLGLDMGNRRLARKMLFHEAAPPFDMVDFHARVTIARNGIETATAVTMSPEAARHLAQHIQTFIRMPPVLGADVTEVEGASENTTEAEQRKIARAQARSESQRQWNKFVEILGNPYAAEMVHMQIGPRMNLSDWAGYAEGSELEMPGDYEGPSRREGGLVRTLLQTDAGRQTLGRHKAATFAFNAYRDLDIMFAENPDLSVQDAVAWYRDRYGRAVASFNGPYELPTTPPGLEGPVRSVQELLAEMRKAAFAAQGGIQFEEDNKLGYYSRQLHKTERQEGTHVNKVAGYDDADRAMTFIHEDDHKARGFMSRTANNPEDAARNILGEVLAPLHEMASGYDAENKNGYTEANLRYMLGNRAALREFVQARYDVYSDRGTDTRYPTFDKGQDDPVDLATDKILELGKTGKSKDPVDNIIAIIRDPSGTGMLGGVDKKGAQERLRVAKNLSYVHQEKLRKYGFTDSDIATGALSNGWTDDTAEKIVALMDADPERFSRKTFAAFDRSIVEQLYAANFGDVSELEGAKAGYNELGMEQLVAVNRVPALLEVFKIAELNRLNGEQLAELELRPQIWETPVGGKPIRMDTLAAMDAAKLRAYGNALAALGPSAAKLSADVLARNAPELKVAESMLKRGVPAELVMAVRGDTLLHLERITATAVDSSDKSLPPEVSRLAESLMPFLSTSRGKLLNDFLVKNGVEPISMDRRLAELDVGEIEPGQDRNELEKDKARAELVGEGFGAEHVNELSGPILFRFWDAYFGNASSGASMEASLVANVRALAEPSDRAAVEALIPQARRLHAIRSLARVGMSRAELEALPPEALATLEKTQQASVEQGASAKHPGNLQEQLQGQLGQEHGDALVTSMHLARDRQTLVAAGVPADVAATVPAELVQKVMQVRRMVALGAEPSVTNTLYQDVMRHPQAMAVRPAIMSAGLETGGMPDDYTIRQDLLAFGVKPDTLATLRPRTVLHLHNARLRNWNAPMVQGVVYGDIKAGLVPGEQVDQAIKELRAVRELDHLEETGVDAAVEPERQVVSTETRLADIDAALKSGQRVYIVPALDGDRYEVFAVDVATGNVEVDDGPPGHETRQSYLLGALNVKGIEIEAGFTEEASVGVQPSGPKDLRLQVKLGEEQKTTDLSTRDEKPVEPEAKKPPSLDSEKMQKAMLRVADKMPAMRQGDVTGPANYNVSGHTVSNVDGSFWWRPGQTNIAVAPPGDSRVLATTLAQDCSIVIATYADGTRAMMHVHGGERGSSRATDDFRRAIADLNSLGQPAEVLVVYAADGRHAAAIPDIERLVASETGSAKVTSINKGTSEINARAISYVDDQGQASYAAEGLTFEGESTFFQAGTMADKAGPARPDLTASKAADAKTATVQSSAQTPEKASIDDAVFSELIGRYLDGPAMTAPELVAWWSRLNPAQKQLATTHPQLSRMLLGDELPRLVKEGHQAELSGMIAEIQGGRSQAQDQRLQVKTGESEAAADEKPKQTKDFSAEVIAWWEKLPSDFDKRAAKKILWHDAAPAFDPEHYQGVLIPLARGGVPIDALVKLDRGAALYLRQHLFTLQATRPILGGQVQDVDAGEGAKAAEAAKRRSARNESQHIWNEFVAMVADDSVVAAIHAGLGPDMGLADWIGQRGEDGKRGRGMIHTLQDKEAGQNFLAEHKRSTFARQALLEVKEAYHADPQLSVERALEVYRNHYQRGVDNFKKYEVSPQAPGIEGLKPDSVDKLIKKIEASLWGVEGGVSDPFSPMGAYARSGNKATDRANMVGMLKDPSESDEARARGFVHEADHVIRGFNTEEAHSSARVAANILGEVLAPLAEAASGYESDSKVTADSILADQVIDREKVRSFAQIVFDNYSQYFPEQFREFEGETHPVDLVADKIIEISQSGQGSPRDNLLFALQNPSAVGMLGAQDPEWALGKAHSAHRVQSGKVLGLEREQRMRQHGFSEMHIQASVTLQGWTAMTADQSMALVEDGRTPSELLAMTPEQIAQAFEARDGGKVDVAPVDSQRGAVVALPEGARLETWGSTQVVVGDTEVMGVKATRVLPIAGHSDLNDAAMRLGSTRLVHVSGITNKAFYLQEESVYGISPASKDAGVLTAADAKNVETLAGRAAANVRAQLDLGDGKSDFSRLLEQSIGATQLRTDAETQETLPQEAVPLSQQAEEARAKYEALKSDRKASPLQRYDARQEADRLGKELEQQQIEEEREKHRQLGASVLDEVIANTEARRAAGELQETERESEPARWSMPMPHDDETPAFEALLSAPTVGALVHAKRGSKWMPGTLLGPDPANADNVLVRFAKGEGSEDVSVAIASVALTKAQKGAVMEQHQGEGAKILEDLLANPQPTREQKSADQTAKEYVDAVAHDAVYRTSDILAKEKEVQAIESELGFPAYLDSQKWADSKRELENLKYSVAPLDAREREKFEALREIDPKTTELSSAEKAYIKSLEDLLGKKKLFHKQDADLRALVEEVKAYPEKNKAAAKSQARRKLQQQQGSSDFRYYRLPHSSTEIAAAFPRARRGEFDVIETLFKTDPDYVEDELWMKVNLFDSWNGKGKLPEDAKALEVRKLVGERLDLYFQARGRGRSLISTSLDAKPAVEPDGPKDLRLSVKLGEEAGPVDLLTAETATAEQQQGAKTRSKEEVAHIRKLTADAFQEYRQAIRDAKDATGEVKSRENLRHIRRIVSSIEGNRASLEGVNVDVDILICGIVLSDIGKTGAALMKTVEIMREQGVDMEENAFFKAFLGHENYGIAMVQERGASYGLNEAEVEAVVAAIRNHNGPGLRHSWWGKTYKQMLGERYGMPEGKEGVTHTILDRVDQGRIVRTEKADGSVKLGGGVVKILHDEAATGKPLGAVVDNVIVNNPKVTKKQIEALRRWYAAVHNDAEVDAIFDTDFIKGQIAQVDDAIKMAARVTYDSVEATTVRVDGVEVDNVNDLLAQLAKDPPAEAAAAQAAIESEGEAKESEALADPLSAEAKKSNPAITLNPIAKMRLGKEGMAWFTELQRGDQRVAKSLMAGLARGAPRFERGRYYKMLRLHKKNVSPRLIFQLSDEALSSLDHNLDHIFRTVAHTDPSQLRDKEPSELRTGQTMWLHFAELAGHDLARAIGEQLAPQMSFAERRALHKELARTEQGQDVLADHKRSTLAFNAVKRTEAWYKEISGESKPSAREVAQHYRQIFEEGVDAYNASKSVSHSVEGSRSSQVRIDNKRAPGLEAGIPADPESLFKQIRGSLFSMYAGPDQPGRHAGGYNTSSPERFERANAIVTVPMAAHTIESHGSTLLHEHDHQARGFYYQQPTSPEAVANNLFGEVIAPLREMATYEPKKFERTVADKSALTKLVQNRMDIYSKGSTEDSFAVDSEWKESPVELVVNKFWEIGESGPGTHLENIKAAVNNPRGTGMLGGLDSAGSENRRQVSARLSLVAQESLRKAGIDDSMQAVAVTEAGWTESTAQQVLGLLDSGRVASGVAAALDANAIETLHTLEFGDEKAIAARAEDKGLSVAELRAESDKTVLASVLSPEQMAALEPSLLAALVKSPNVVQRVAGDTFSEWTAEQVLAAEDLLAHVPGGKNAAAPIGRWTAPEMRLAKALAVRGVDWDAVVYLGGQSLYIVERLSAKSARGQDLTRAEREALEQVLQALNVVPRERLTWWFVGQMTKNKDKGGTLFAGISQPGGSVEALAATGLPADKLAELSEEERDEVRRLFYADGPSHAAGQALQSKSEKIQALEKDVYRAYLINGFKYSGAANEIQEMGAEGLYRAERHQDTLMSGAQIYAEESLRHELGEEAADRVITKTNVQLERNTLIAGGLDADLVRSLSPTEIQQITQLRRLSSLRASDAVIEKKKAELAALPHWPSLEAHLDAITAPLIGRTGRLSLYEKRQDLVAYGASPASVAALDRVSLDALHAMRLKSWNADDPLIQSDLEALRQEAASARALAELEAAEPMATKVDVVGTDSLSISGPEDSREEESPAASIRLPAGSDDSLSPAMAARNPVLSAHKRDTATGQYNYDYHSARDAEGSSFDVITRRPLSHYDGAVTDPRPLDARAAAGVRALEPFGGPRYLGDVRIQDERGTWLPGVAVESTGGMPLADMLKEGVEIPFDITKQHFESLHQLIESFRAAGVVPAGYKSDDSFYASGPLAPSVIQLTPDGRVIPASPNGVREPKIKGDYEYAESERLLRELLTKAQAKRAKTRGSRFWQGLKSSVLGSQGPTDVELEEQAAAEARGAYGDADTVELAGLSPEEGVETILGGVRGLDMTVMLDEVEYRFTAAVDVQEGPQGGDLLYISNIMLKPTDRYTSDNRNSMMGERNQHGDALNQLMSMVTREAMERGYEDVRVVYQRAAWSSSSKVKGTGKDSSTVGMNLGRRYGKRRGPDLTSMGFTEETTPQVAPTRDSGGHAMLAKVNLPTGKWSRTVDVEGFQYDFTAAAKAQRSDKGNVLQLVDATVVPREQQAGDPQRAIEKVESELLKELGGDWGGVSIQMKNGEARETLWADAGAAGAQGRASWARIGDQPQIWSPEAAGLAGDVKANVLALQNSAVQLSAETLVVSGQKISFDRIDLMGGAKSSLPSFLNVDLVAEVGVQADLAAYPLPTFIVPGSVKEVVVSNPQADFFADVAQILASGGTVTVNGNWSNKFFKRIFTKSGQIKHELLEELGFEIETEIGPLDERFRDQKFHRTDGLEIPLESMQTFVLRKK